MKISTTIKGCLLSCLLFVAWAIQAAPPAKQIYFYGNVKNDLYLLLKREGFTIRKYETPDAAVNAAPIGAGVFILANDYPKMDAVNRISKTLLDKANKKRLRLYIEYPVAFPGLNIPDTALKTRFERGVVTAQLPGTALRPMDLLGIQDCHVLSVTANNPLLVLAKVVGFDKAEYGLDSTKTYPLLFEQNGALVSMTGLSNFTSGRYAPRESIKALWTFILARITNDKTFRISKWVEDVRPTFTRNAPLSPAAKLTSIKKGTQWFNNGRFFVDPVWKDVWEKYGNKPGSPATGPAPDPKFPNGNGDLGIIEGHSSTIYYNGAQRYNYWMRADVQGEVSMALAAAGDLLQNDDFKKRSANLIDFLFNTSNMVTGAKKDTNSAAYGLIGWATTVPYTFYGDDNARAILGIIGAAGYLKTDKWDQQLAAAIMANFRTTGRQGFRSDRLEEGDIIKNGWPFYYNRDLQNIIPHFESWMWACYLWLYDKTGYEPLLTRTKEAIRITMNAYPKKWLWGSSMQMQRARMILPLAWLVRLENTEEHRKWLDIMITEIMKYQDESGAIREEIGKGRGHFKELKTNADYGTDEGSLIFRNGEKVSCMLYTCNFALFSLNEAAAATGNTKYQEAANKLSDFMTRIQVKSEKHRDLDGAWLRGFDYGRWDYWASNSDAGWGAWCTLTGWCQSWIVTTKVQIQQQKSFWDVTKKSGINKVAAPTIKMMMRQ